MNRTAIFLVTCASLLHAQSFAASDAIDPGRVLEIGPNHRVIATVSLDPAGNPVTNQVVQIASGMNWLNPDTGLYEPAQTEFTLARDGSAVISRAQTRLIVSPNINSAEGALDLETMDGQRYRLGVLALCLYDPVTGQHLQIAEVQDSIGELIGPATVLWRDCFRGLSADLRVVCEAGQIHHDVILRERPSPDLLKELGFADPRRLRIEVWSEFLEAPEPEKTVSVARAEPDEVLRQTMVEPDLMDEALDFGELRVGTGRAFADPAGAVSTEAGVGKLWINSDGRRLLVESCSWEDLEPLLERLPESDLGAGIQNVAEDGPMLADLRPSTQRVLPPRPKASEKTGEILLAQADLEPRPGVVLDFVAVTGTLANYVFSADKTFHVTGNVGLSTSVTFEGGAIIKFNPGTKLSILSGTTVYCKTGPYQPVVLTARDDDSLGEIVPGSTHTPSGYYANPALEITCSGSAPSLSNVRIHYATKGIQCNYNAYDGQGPEFRHLQVTHCQDVLNTYCSNARIRNALFHQVSSVFPSLYYSTVRAEHLTVNTATWFNKSPSPSTYLYVTNSLLVQVTTPGSYSGAGNATEASGSTVFEPVGAGLHYLKIGSTHRNVGVTTIDLTLANELKKKTTYAPAIYSTPVNGQDLVLEPQAWRDVDTPDRGFHYDPIDYAVNTLEVTGATLTLTNGVALATYGQNGIWLNSGSRLDSTGLPESPNRISRFSAVMEQPDNWGGGGVANNLAVCAYPTSGASPTVQCRFTAFDGLGAGNHFYVSTNGWLLSDLSLQDCSFYSAGLWLQGGAGSTVFLKNNLFQGVNVSLANDHTLSAYNNLFRRGYVTLDCWGTWVIKDNVFDRCDIADFSLVSPVHSHNAYVSTTGLTGRIGTAQTGDVTLSNLAYYTGALGSYYQHSASSLLEAGSRTVAAAGLAQHTATINYAKDTGQVAIGLHYVATVNGLPMDTDGDGLPDYFEDADGDGQVGTIETDPGNVDTDGDGLSDGAETQVTGTDPLDPASKNHNKEYVVCSINHPLWKSATSSGTDVVTFSAKLLVARGVDALRLYVDVSTSELESGRTNYNDHLTYLVQSPLIGIVGGSFNIADIGSENPLIIFPPEWFICHAKTLVADSYVTVKLTALNVNSAGGMSTVGVGLSALRVDFGPVLGPSGDNRLVFDSGQPGMLPVNLGATVLPGEAAAFDFLDQRVRFEVDAIGDSELHWITPGGVGSLNGNIYENEAWFFYLPTNNSAFGPKNVRCYVDGRWGLEGEQPIKVFFPADAYNYPGCPPVSDPEIDRFVPPNYFFYYSQIPSVVYGSPLFHYLASMAKKPWMTNPPYPYYVEARRDRLGYPVHFGINAGRTYEYINVFAYSCRHEATHGNNYAGWWPQKHRYPNEPLDRDNEAVPNDVEIANDYNPDNPVTFPRPPGILNWDDDQRYTLNIEPEWEPGQGDTLDWAHPGAQWP